MGVRVAFWIVAAQLLFAWIVSWSLGHYAGPPIVEYLRLVFCLTVFLGVVALVAQTFALRWAENPSKLLLQKARDNRDLYPVILSVIGLCILQKAALTWVKPALPMANGFWADTYLANAEAAMLGGDPWRFTHWLVGAGNAFIDVVYLLWFTTIVCVLICVSASRKAAKQPVIVSYFAIFAICMVVQFLLPSAGPVFWQKLGLGDRFADLQTPTLNRGAIDYLWSFYLSSKEGLAVGISAFPSVHVAMAAWVVIAVRALWPRLLFVAGAWYAVILFGSVYLGWHYLIDGIAGSLIALFAYRLVQRRVTWPAFAFSSRRRI